MTSSRTKRDAGQAEGVESLLQGSVSLTARPLYRSLYGRIDQNMYVLVNPGPKEQLIQCAHTTWNQLTSIATLELFGIPTPRTVHAGSPSAVRMADGKSAVGVAVNVNTARRTIVIPREAKEIRLLSDTGCVLRRYYWDAANREPVEEIPEPAEAGGIA